MNRYTGMMMAAALASVSVVVAQEEEAEKPAATAEASEQVAAQPKTAEKVFHTLTLCRAVEGAAELLRPGAKDWEPIEEGRFYPFGCTYRTTSSAARLTMEFGSGSEVRLEGEASFATRAQPVGMKDRTIVLKSGAVHIQLPRNMSPEAFKVAAPGFTVKGLAGESVITYAGTGDGDEAIVRCVTGTLAVEGRHFGIPKMGAANEVKIRTSQDMLFTGLYGTSGDYIVKLDQGLFTTHDIETAAEKTENRQLDWHLSPRTAVRIHRAKPAIGERMSVTVMTFDESGLLINRCAFAEGLAALSTGEQGEEALKVKEETAKRAMQEADAVTTEAAPEEASEEESKDKDNNETKQEESSEE